MIANCGLITVTVAKIQRRVFIIFIFESFVLEQSLFSQKIESSDPFLDHDRIILCIIVYSLIHAHNIKFVYMTQQIKRHWCIDLTHSILANVYTIHSKYENTTTNIKNTRKRSIYMHTNILRSHRYIHIYHRQKCIACALSAGVMINQLKQIIYAALACDND